MKLVWVSLVAALLALLSPFSEKGAAADEGGPGGRALTAQVRIGPAPWRFRIDLSASGCSLSDTGARTLRLPVIGSETAPLLLARSASVDGISLGDLSCARGAEDVLGGGIFRGLVVKVDAAAGGVSVYGGAQHGQALVGPDARLLYASPLAGGAPAIPVRLNGAVGMAVFDPSRATSQINSAFRDRAGRDSGGGGDVLDLAGFRISQRPETSDAVAGVADRPLMILGRDALRGFALVIDYPNARIWIDPQG